MARSFGVGGLDPGEILRGAARDSRNWEDEPGEFTPPVPAAPVSAADKIREAIVNLARRFDVMDEILRRALPGKDGPMTRGEYIELKEAVEKDLFAPKPPPGMVTVEQMEAKIQERIGELLEFIDSRLPPPAPEATKAEPEVPATPKKK